MSDEDTGYQQIRGTLNGVPVRILYQRFTLRTNTWFGVPLPSKDAMRWSIRNEGANHIRVGYEEKMDPSNPQFFTILAQGLPRDFVAEDWLPEHIWVQRTTAANNDFYVEFVVQDQSSGGRVH